MSQDAPLRRSKRQQAEQYQQAAKKLKQQAAEGVSDTQHATEQAKRKPKSAQPRPAQPAPGDMAGLDEHNLMRLSYMTEDQLLLRVKKIKRRDKLVSFIAMLKWLGKVPLAAAAEARMEELDEAV